MLKAHSKLLITAEPKHLLWVLMWLKLYKLEPTMVSIAKVHCNTFRKWKIVISIADLYKKVVSIVMVVCNLFFKALTKALTFAFSRFSFAIGSATTNEKLAR
jgi:hypothetical protein